MTEVERDASPVRAPRERTFLCGRLCFFEVAKEGQRCEKCKRNADAIAKVALDHETNYQDSLVDRLLSLPVSIFRKQIQELGFTILRRGYEIDAILKMNYVWFIRPLPELCLPDPDTYRDTLVQVFGVMTRNEAIAELTQLRKRGDYTFIRIFEFGIDKTKKFGFPLTLPEALSRSASV
jgi:hypothetical protein